MLNKKPLVTVACLCEKVLSEPDGVLSLIRIVDQYTVSAPPAVLESALPQLVITLVLGLKSNGLVGKHEVVVQMHGPAKSQEPHKIDVEFQNQPLAGFNIVTQVAIGLVKNFGEARFDVTFDGEFLTSIPFRLLQAPAQATEISE